MCQLIEIINVNLNPEESIIHENLHKEFIALNKRIGKRQLYNITDRKYSPKPKEKSK